MAECAKILISASVIEYLCTCTLFWTFEWQHVTVSGINLVSNLKVYLLIRT